MILKLFIEIIQRPVCSKKLLNYIKFFILDFIVLLKNRPNFVIVQTPPSFILIAPVIYKVFYRKVKVISDTHNAMTRSPWKDRFGTSFLFNKVDLICVHNDVVYESVKDEIPFKKSNISILEDKTIDYEPIIETHSSTNENKEAEKGINVFFPASFNEDEPIKEILDCAVLNQDINFTLTGNAVKLEKKFGIAPSDLPDNFKITGWLTNEEYNRTLMDCDVLLGLTIFDDIQMSVSNEGLGAEKVMVLSDKKALRNIYKSGAIYTENSASEIAQRIREAHRKRDVLKKEIKKIQRN